MRHKLYLGMRLLKILNWRISHVLTLAQLFDLACNANRGMYDV